MKGLAMRRADFVCVGFGVPEQEPPMKIQTPIFMGARRKRRPGVAAAPGSPKFRQHRYLCRRRILLKSNDWYRIVPGVTCSFPIKLAGLLVGAEPSNAHNVRGRAAILNIVVAAFITGKTCMRHYFQSKCKTNISNNAQKYCESISKLSAFFFFLRELIQHFVRGTPINAIFA